MSRHTTIAVAVLLLFGTATGSSQSTLFYADQDIPVANGGLLNDYTYTHASDNAYQGIAEMRTGGAPHEKETYLIHKWAFPVTSTYDSWAFHVEAYHTLTTGHGADDFIFAWSVDDSTYYRLLWVTKTADDDVEQVRRFYPPPADTIYIRVTDTNIAGFKDIDTIYVDHMYIENYHDDIPPVISDVTAESVDGPAWVHMSPDVVGGTLEGRYRHAMAYDSAADKTILFGGRDESSHLVDTWTYDYATNSWDHRAPAVIGGPLAARIDHAMVYDSASSQSIMFGGRDGAESYLNDTWIYDCALNTWTNADPEVVDGPLEARGHHAMAYDTTNQDTILVGGYTNVLGHLRETWIYDSAANVWTSMTPTMTVVGGDFPGIAEHSLAYDPVAQRTILFGGSTPEGPTNATWAYDSAANTWHNRTLTMTVLGGALTPRYGHAMAYDAAAGKVIMFGGQDESGVELSDTWTYDYGTNTWQKLDPQVAGGTFFGRQSHAMVYDSANSATILFGGWKDGQPRLGDTWMLTDRPAAVVTWTTDELSDSLVRFGTAAPPTTPVANGTLLQNHHVVLRDLLAYPTVYSYEVQSTDVGSNTKVDDNGGAYYTFTIGAPNAAPSPPADPSPENGATGAGLDVTLSVFVSDPDADDMDVSFYDEFDTLIGTDYAVASGSRASVEWNGLSPDTTYNWYAVATDQGASTPSAAWAFTTGSPGGMYVWNIAWKTKQAGSNTFLTHIVTVHYDSDHDGVAEETDALVSDATVDSTLTHTDTQQTWNFSGVTVDGVVEFTQKVSDAGQYEAEVMDITHPPESYTPEMDQNNPSTYGL